MHFVFFSKYDAAVDAVANNLDMVGIKAICVKSASKKLPIPSHISSSMIGACVWSLCPVRYCLMGNVYGGGCFSITFNQATTDQEVAVLDQKSLKGRP